MAVFGVDIAGQIQKLRRERRLGLGLIKLLYPGVKGDEALGREVCRDMAFTTLGYVVMQAQQRVGQPCWRYWFDYVAEAEHQTYPHGAWHGNEVAYVFDNLDLAEPVRQYANDRDRAFAGQVADYWLTSPAWPVTAATISRGRCAGPPAYAVGIVCCVLACINALVLRWKTALCARGWRCFVG